MVTLALSVTREFLSDLYHDALWVEQNVQPDVPFDYLIRRSGTNIAATAKVGVAIGTGSDSQFWRIRVFDKRGNGDWHAEFTSVHLIDVAALPDVH